MAGRVCEVRGRGQPDRQGFQGQGRAGRLLASGWETLPLCHLYLCLQGWKEAKVTFPPTFKFKLGTHSYLGEVAGDVADVDDNEEGGAGQ